MEKPREIICKETTCFAGQFCNEKCELYDKIRRECSIKSISKALWEVVNYLKNRDRGRV